MGNHARKGYHLLSAHHQIWCQQITPIKIKTWSLGIYTFTQHAMQYPWLQSWGHCHFYKGRTIKPPNRFISAGGFIVSTHFYLHQVFHPSHAIPVQLINCYFFSMLSPSNMLFLSYHLSNLAASSFYILLLLLST